MLLWILMDLNAYRLSLLLISEFICLVFPEGFHHGTNGFVICVRRGTGNSRNKKLI